MSDLDDLRAYCARLESDVTDLAQVVVQLRGELADAVAGDSVKAAMPSLPEVEAWVRDDLSVTYARTVGNAFRWCPRWQDHPEAVLRLTALCAGHRDAQRTGRMLPYLRDLDAQMAVLTAADGPFAACSRNCHPADPLPSD